MQHKTKTCLIMGRKRKIEKEPVTIRYKELANGNKSIYLDIYQDGKRKYDFLKLYLVPENGRGKFDAKRKNAEALAVANVIKAQRVLDIKNGIAGLSNKKSKMKLMDFIDIYAERKTKTTKSDEDPNGVVRSTKKHLALYKGEDVLLKDIDKDFCLGFIEHLKRYKMKNKAKLSTNSRWAYYKIFANVLRVAEDEGLIPKSPDREVASQLKPKLKECNRVYLNIDEVNMLAQQECRFPMVKNAFMFSCFCGLRISDIRRLKWTDIEETKGEDGTTSFRLSLRMTKTKKNISFQLSNEAASWLPEKTDAPLVFHDLVKDSCLAYTVKDWAKESGITKDVTFHTARHTFATMMLTLGADIYTTSKLLGHTSVATTEIYAKIVDKKKDEAVGLIDKFYTENESGKVESENTETEIEEHLNNDKTMAYHVYYNNIAIEKEVAEFNTLRQAKSYCKSMNNGKQLYTPGSTETHHCYEIYEGEVDDDSEPIWATEWFFD